MLYIGGATIVDIGSACDRCESRQDEMHLTMRSRSERIASRAESK